MLPNFLIVGVQRGGTTSLYNYLIMHENIIGASTKEIHFFDNNFHRGISWYQSQFENSSDTKNTNESITGEASPYYIFHPLVPKRILGVIPKVKLIILLRNPVDRAYSHYWHERRLGIESLSFEDAIKSEAKRLEGEEQKMLQDETYYSFNHQNYSYLSRGIYVDNLKRWLPLFSREQFFILKSEDLFFNPQQVFNKTLDFLNLTHFKLEKYEKTNAGTYEKINEKTRKHLEEYFKPHNENLNSFLGMDFGW
jgi:hypothetical protein